MGGDSSLTYSLDDYDYDLPDDRVAQAPLENRHSSRLLVLERSSGRLAHHRFEELIEFLREGDVLVVNDTRVVRARLSGRKETGGAVELLVLDPYKDPEEVEKEGTLCLFKSSKPLRPGMRVLLPKGLSATVLSSAMNGRVYVRFPHVRSVTAMLGEVGEVPLPPYIERNGGEPSLDDRAAYQTVYARNPGAVAAPTAGLHFTEVLLQALETRNVQRVSVTLHVGYGTFSPIRCRDIRQHRMHREYVQVSDEAAAQIGKAGSEGRRIVAVGTTVVRTLEWLWHRFGRPRAFAGFCDHYIYPGYRFGIVDSMITNFHLPRSTLLLLVSAFAGRENTLGAYREAIASDYRFFSYGDAMLIL